MRTTVIFKPLEYSEILLSRSVHTIHRRYLYDNSRSIRNKLLHRHRSRSKWDGVHYVRRKIECRKIVLQETGNFNIIKCRRTRSNTNKENAVAVLEYNLHLVHR